MRVASLLAAVLCLAAAPPARGDESPNRTRRVQVTLVEAADAVRKAFEANDIERLKALLRDGPLDPWLVADMLAVQGHLGVAKAFSTAQPHPDTERLAAYLEDRRDADDAADREALERANRAFEAGDMDAVFAAVGARRERPILVAGIRLERARAVAHIRRKQNGEALAAYRNAAAGAHAIGWLRQEADLLARAGSCAYAARDPRTAVALMEAALALEDRRGDEDRQLRLLGYLADTLNRLGVPREALRYQSRVLAIQRKRGDRAGIGRSLQFVGTMHLHLSEWQQALAHMRQALEVAEALGDTKQVSVLLGDIGTVLREIGQGDEARDYLERSLQMTLDAGNHEGEARSRVNLAVALYATGELVEAREHLERALVLAKETGAARVAGAARVNLALVLQAMGDLPNAERTLVEALAVVRTINDLRGIAKTLTNLALVRIGLGDLDQALKDAQESATRFAALSDRPGEAMALEFVGAVHMRRGAYAKAFALLDRGLRLAEAARHPRTIVTLLSRMGIALLSLGDYERALEYTDRCIATIERHHPEGSRRASLTTRGIILSRLERHEEAIAVQKQLLALSERGGKNRDVAYALLNLGFALINAGAPEEALPHLERAHTLAVGDENRHLRARCLISAGGCLRRVGRIEASVAALEEALGLARDAEDHEAVVSALSTLALTHLQAKDPERAAAQAREALALMEPMTSALADEQGAAARQRWASLFETGALAGAAMGSAEETAFFLEAGRAVTLLEALGGRDALQGQLLPADLREELARTRAQESVAAAMLAHVRHSQPTLAAVREARKALRAARQAVREAVDRAQRHAKAAAQLLYPRPVALDALQAELDAGDALVLYGLTTDHVLAVVVTKENARLVPLGDSGPIGEAIAALALQDEDVDAAEALAKLESLVVAPLKLGPEVRRVLVSPQGRLAYVPFALLLGERNVLYVPSATTWHQQRQQSVANGSRVLALGDPDYGTVIDPGAVMVRVQRGGLRPLPATRDEAKAVGNVVLLGKDANEEALVAALGGQPRWRAVHLACHGLVDAQRPAFSSLALTPTDQSDGFLTCLEILRLSVPADLVALSACETAKGRIYRGEGIVGLTRAFMQAGARRVLCSLWKVDDEATRALMLKFYELWNPKRGKGIGAAAALKKAQEFVRGHEKWKHPYFWAAWVLWGLGE